MKELFREPSDQDHGLRVIPYHNLALLGMLTNLVVILICLLTGRHFLLEMYALILLILTAIGYTMAKKHLTPAVHLMLISYLVVFTAAAHSDLIALPLMLVYPIIVGLAFLLFQQRLNQLIYVVGSGIGLLFNIYFQFSMNLGHDMLLVVSSIATGLSLLLTFAFMSYSQHKSLKMWMRKVNEKEQALISQNEELIRYIDSNLKLERFAHIAAHDLRSPLRTLAGFTALLNRSLDRDLDNQSIEYMKIIQDTIGTMAAQVEDLLEFSEANSQDLKLNPLNLKELIEGVVNEFNPGASHDQNWIALVDVDVILVGDSLKLRRVFQNIISNAIKFSKKSPKIDVSYSHDDKFHFVEIADNGVGIPKEYQEQVFEFYTRLEPEQFEGTGMGLSIARKIVERHGGTITIKENKPFGTIFRFSISKNLATGAQ